MAFRGLRGYLEAPESDGKLRRIAADVSPLLDITEIADHVAKKQGPALLCERA